MQEVEHGLHQCQTLLEHYTDIAFDSFEAWCLRNIFAVPPGLPYVLPHQEGLDLTTTPEQEQELLDEINALREQLANVRCHYISIHSPSSFCRRRRSVVLLSARCE